MNKEFYLKAALIGGCVAGFLSVIPIVNWLNIICCLWVLVGGGTAVYILTTSAPGPVTYGDGAVVGLLAGLIAGVISGVLHLLIPFASIGAGLAFLERFADRMPHFIDYPWMARTAAVGAGMMIVGLFSRIIIYAVFGTLGGVIGTAIFVKKKEPPAKA
ncbi:hypothetical protein CEE39_09525 [bacterium (candidate division B38) B3_B38]|nr:MAG: hypothetical protein CEE39_09525 [bacterium (candidate division B38) B3_B38]